MGQEMQVSVGDCVEFYLGDVLGGDDYATGRTQGVVNSVDVYGTLTVFTADEDTVRISPNAVVILAQATEAPQAATVALDIVEVNGRTLEGIKFLGMVPEALAADDYNVYVRWNGAKVTADRSDTDAMLVAAHVTKTQGKADTLRQLFENLATFYGAPVIVSADPGVKVNATVTKLLGTYLPRDYTAQDLKPSTLVVGPGPVEAKSAKPRPVAVDVPTAKPCGVAGCKTGQPAVMLLKIATGPSAKWTNDVYFCGVCWPYYRHSTELGNVVESVALIHPWDYVTEAEMIAIGLGNHCSNGRCGTCAACDLAMRRHLVADPFGAKVTVGGFENAGTAEFPVAATVERVNPFELDASDIAEANAQAWAEAGSPRDDQGQPIIPTGAELEAIMAEHDAAMAKWLKPLLPALVPALPVRTPGASLGAWDLVEAEIWAGTDLVEPMRRTRLSRKGKRALEKAFRADCCGRADHERYCRTWRPITRQRARRMGISRNDAALLTPRFADLLAVRVGKVA